MSRLSFRPRPLDIHKRLPIVRSVKELDADDGTAAAAAGIGGGGGARLHGATDSDGDQSRREKTRKTVGDIPIPYYEVVPSYERDYTPTFAQPQSYVRSKPATRAQPLWSDIEDLGLPQRWLAEKLLAGVNVSARSEDGAYVEYDLDDEDEDWLDQFNDERKILPPEKFEWMLYKLELLDHRQREKAGIGLLVLGNPVPIMLQREMAYEILRTQTTRQAVTAAVYDYWKAKRERWQKPILRRLQPAPSNNDTNPFNVFRPRERVHRPHTRRMQRRENDVHSFEKLRQVRKKLEEAKILLLELQRREAKKKELVECEVQLHRLHVRLRHDPRLDEDEYVAQPQFSMMPPPPLPRKPTLARSDSEHLERMNGHLLGMRKRTRRRNFPGAGRGGRRVAPLEPLEPVLLFTQPLNLSLPEAAPLVPFVGSTHHSSGAGAGGDPLRRTPQCLRGRFGRGGRVIFDRWDVLSRAALLPCDNGHSHLGSLLMQPAATAATPRASPPLSGCASFESFPQMPPPHQYDATAATIASCSSPVHDLGKNALLLQPGRPPTGFEQRRES
eukprot:SM000003S11109  [mRNA]  locus=s3:1036341:1040455:+ [translate_table: standard]